MQRILPQVTVIFLVDVEKAVPTKEAWPAVWQEQLAWRKAKAGHEAAATATAAEVRWLFLYALMVASRSEMWHVSRQAGPNLSCLISLWIQ